MHELLIEQSSLYMMFPTVTGYDEKDGEVQQTSIEKALL